MSKMEKKNKSPRAVKPADPIDGLRLSTLAGTFESAREILTLVPMHQINTTDQLIEHVKKMLRQRDQMFALFKALDHLDTSSRRLGATTLVAPVDHPLVVRHTIPRDAEV